MRICDRRKTCDRSQVNLRSKSTCDRSAINWIVDPEDTLKSSPIESLVFVSPPPHPAAKTTVRMISLRIYLITISAPYAKNLLGEGNAFSSMTMP